MYLIFRKLAGGEEHSYDVAWKGMPSTRYSSYYGSF